MKRKRLIVLALAAFTALAFWKLYTDAKSTEGAYEQALAAAAQYEELKLYEKAIQKYQEAQSINETLDTALKIGNVYMITEQFRSAETVGVSAQKRYPREPAAYEFLADVFAARNKYDELYDLLEAMHAQEVTSEKMELLEKQIYDKYYIIPTFLQDGSVFSNGCSPILDEDGYGYINAGGSLAIACKYQKCGHFTGPYAGAFDGDSWFLITINGVHQENLSAKLGAVSAVGNMNYGMIPICVDGHFGYYDVSSLEYRFGDYEEANMFYEDVASVEKDGKWFFIDTQGNPVSDAFEGIVTDERGIARNNGRSFVKSGKAYYMIDESFKRVSDTAYEDVRPFGSDGLAAVKVKGLWGFVDTAGSMVMEAKYDDARSFCNGYAAVKTADGWNLINQKEELVVQENFDGAYDVSSGSIFVRRGNSWSLLRFYRFD